VHSENHHFKINQKASGYRLRTTTCTALSPKVVQAMQLELYKFNTSYYLLILYLQFTYPKIANLIQILYIVCRALGCFKGGSCEKFDV